MYECLLIGIFNLYFLLEYLLDRVLIGCIVKLVLFLPFTAGITFSSTLHNINMQHSYLCVRSCLLYPLCCFVAFVPALLLELKHNECLGFDCLNVSADFLYLYSFSIYMTYLWHLYFCFDISDGTLLDFMAPSNDLLLCLDSACRLRFCFLFFTSVVNQWLME